MPDEQTSRPPEDVLADLEQASRRREQALLELADEVPAAVSRTALLSEMLKGLGDVVPGRRTP